MDGDLKFQSLRTANMITDIGIIISSYVIFRALEMIFRREDLSPVEKNIILVIGIIVIIVTVIFAADLIFISKDISSLLGN